VEKNYAERSVVFITLKMIGGVAYHDMPPDVEEVWADGT
jgi:hypothetical protein